MNLPFIVRRLGEQRPNADAPPSANAGRPLPAGTEASEHLAHNIEAICSVYAKAEGEVLRHQRIVESVTAFVGRASFAYGVIAFIALWLLLDLILPVPFDPAPFSKLQGIIAVSALLISTIVVITQNRQGQVSEQRAHLQLQISLLAEQKIAKMIALIEELRRDMPSVKNRFDAEATMMQRPADPHQVLSAIEEGLHGAPLAADSVRTATVPDDPSIVSGGSKPLR